MSDTASHFKNHMRAALEKSLGVDRRFSGSNSPWSNGTCERMMREVVRDRRGEAEHQGLGRVGAGGSVGFAYFVPRKIWFHTLSCHVR